MIKKLGQNSIAKDQANTARLSICSMEKRAQQTPLRLLEQMIGHPTVELQADQGLKHRGRGRFEEATPSI